MPSFNSVTLMGNLTRDPELKYLPSGTAVAEFGLAVNNKYTSKDGELKEDVCFIDIVTWTKTAENCANYLSKGRPVLIQGRLQMDSWRTDDGQKRTKHKVVAQTVQFLGGPQETEKDDVDDVDDDVPF